MVHGLNRSAGVEQDHGIRQGFERGFERVFRPDDLTDIGAPKLGKILGHLVERASQLAKLVSRGDVNPLGEFTCADRIRAPGQVGGPVQPPFGSDAMRPPPRCRAPTA